MILHGSVNTEAQTSYINTASLSQSKHTNSTLQDQYLSEWQDKMQGAALKEMLHIITTVIKTGKEALFPDLLPRIYWFFICGTAKSVHWLC
jgi:hypothetical protein